MKTHGFMRIATTGKPFDGDVHELVEEEPSEALAAGVVVREIGRGYQRDGFLLRAARVSVSTGTPKGDE